MTEPGVRKRILWTLGALLSAGVALVSYRYLLRIGTAPPLIVGNLHKDPWLALHATAAATALLVGPVQFLPGVRARYRALHRWTGRTYVAACAIGGTAGFVLALGASTGWISTAGFGSLAILWVGTTAIAWRRAVRRDLAAHRVWMVRSFALAFAAVTLRLYLPVISQLPVPYDEGYRAVSFLCWVPNLVAAELYVRGWRAPGAAA